MGHGTVTLVIIILSHTPMIKLKTDFKNSQHFNKDNKIRMQTNS